MDAKSLELYADGGIIGRNPSSVGGTWAWVIVDHEGRVVKQESGVMTPDMGVGGYVTNNVSELYALCRGIRALPLGCKVIVHSDSLVTLLRVFKRGKLNGVPDWLVHFMDGAIDHLDTSEFTWKLLDGHPTKAQLAAGVGKRGGPVSVWNVWCDETCGDEAKKHQAKLNQAAAA